MIVKNLRILRIQKCCNQSRFYFTNLWFVDYFLPLTFLWSQNVYLKIWWVSNRLVIASLVTNLNILLCLIDQIKFQGRQILILFSFAWIQVQWVIIVNEMIVFVEYKFIVNSNVHAILLHRPIPTRKRDFLLNDF